MKKALKIILYTILSIVVVLSVLMVGFIYKVKNGFPVFYEKEKPVIEVYQIDGESIDPNGNILFVKDKNFGMGKAHPVAWYKAIGKGKTFYTSIGHTRQAFEETPFIQLLENVVRWQVQGSGNK